MRVVDALGVVALGGALLLGAITLRRWRLLHSSGAIECALRRNARRGGGGWSLGVLRFAGDQLTWTRVLSLSPRPALTIARRAASVTSRRTAVAAEHIAVTVGGAVLELSVAGAVIELAVMPGALTGIVAWLEASAPGMSRSLAG